MGQGKELAKNTLIIAFGKICTQSVSFFLLPIYTALLTTSDYGIVDLFGTYIHLLIPIISLQIDQGIFRYVIKAKDEEEISDVVTNTFAFYLLIVFVYGFVYGVIQLFISNPYKIFLYISVIISIFSSMLLQLARGLNDNMTYAIGSTISGIGTVVFNVILIVGFGWGALGMFLSGVLANIISCGYLVHKTRISSYFSIKRLNKLEIKRILKYTGPLVPSALSWWAIDSSDRTIVSYILGVSANGVLSIAHKIPSIITQFFNIFNIAWVQYVITHFDDDDRDFQLQKMINQIVALCIAGCLMIIAIIPFIFRLLINENFYDAYYQIPILIIAVLFTVITNIYTSFYISIGNSEKIGSTALIAGIVDVIVHLALITKLGLYAATLSSAIAYGVMMVWRHKDCVSFVNVRLNKKICVSAVFAFVFVMIGYYSNKTLLKLIVLMVSFIYSLFINNTTLRMIYNILTLNLERRKSK